MIKIIYITGGSASGKSHLSKHLMEHFGSKAALLSQDSFYKPKGTSKTNYDIPSAFDWKLMKDSIKSLRRNKKSKVPVYDFAKHDVIGEELIEVEEVLIFEGLFTMYNEEIAALADFKIFVDTPSDIRISRRILRDVKDRGRTVKSVIDRWHKDVQPSFKKYILPLKRTADVIIPWSSINNTSLNILITSITHMKIKKPLSL